MLKSSSSPSDLPCGLSQAPLVSLSPPDKPHTLHGQQVLLSCHGGHGGAGSKAEMGPEIFSTQCCLLLQHEEVGFILQTCTQSVEPQL